jgi:hypothetical protein
MSRGDYDDTDGEPAPLSRRTEAAFDRVRTPGTMLQVFGLVSVFLAVTSLAVYVIAPEQILGRLWDMATNANKNNPNAVQGLPPRNEYIAQGQVQGIAAAAVSLICSVPIFIGGGKMKQLTGYGWAMTGSVMAMIPCTNSCCCVGLPVGIWAIVVLVNSDVKAAFRSSSEVRPRGDDFGDRR